MVFSISVSRISPPICARASDAANHANAVVAASRMRLKLRGTRLTATESAALRRLRQCALLAAAAAVLSQCGPGVPVGTVGHVTGFVGAVTADEPRAAMAARDVLSAGGSAADAAIAMYFVLSVTMPASAGLGGGGACVAHDAKGKRTEALDFMPDRKSTRLNSSHIKKSRMPSSA